MASPGIDDVVAAAAADVVVAFVAEQVVVLGVADEDVVVGAAGGVDEVLDVEAEGGADDGPVRIGLVALAATVPAARSTVTLASCSTPPMTLAPLTVLWPSSGAITRSKKSVSPSSVNRPTVSAPSEVTPSAATFS